MNISNIATDNSTSSVKTTRYILIPIISVIGIDVILGNTLILASILKFRRLRTKTNILVGNLAIADLLVGLIVIPYEITMILKKDFGSQKYHCLWRQTLFSIFLGSAIFSLFCISMERYFAIVHPFTHFKRCTPKALGFCVICCWGVASAIGILPVLGLNRWTPSPICDNRIALYMEYNGIVYVIYTTSLTINFIMFLKIVKAVWTHLDLGKKTVNDNVGQRHQSMRQKEVNRTKAMVLVLGLFVLCWGPFLFYLLIELFFLKISHGTNVLKACFRVIGLFNSGINWILYGGMNSLFRMAFKQILTCGKIRKSEELYQSSIRTTQSSLKMTRQ